MIDIGKRIKELRGQKGLTTNGLAYKTGISQSYIRELEAGKYNNPTIGIIDEVCWALGVTISEFFAESEQKTKKLNDDFEKVVSRLSPEQKESLTKFLNTMVDWGF